MKTINHTLFYIALLLNLLCCSNVLAQNVLSIPDMRIKRNSQMQMPVNVTNASSIVAMQFTLQIPQGFSISGEPSFSDRQQDHVASMKSLGNGRYNIMVYSTSNQPLRGNSGTVLTLPLYVGSSIKEGETYQASFEDGAVLSLSTGENVITGTEVGIWRVDRYPDLEVSNIQTNTSHVMPGDTLEVSWTVTNLGDLSTTGGWVEHVYLTDGSQETFLGTLYNADALLADGQKISRSAKLPLPIQCRLDGEVHVKVQLKPNSDCGEHAETLENNTAYTTQPLTLDKFLTLSPTYTKVTEGRTSRLSYLLNRSGRTTSDQTFELSATADSRVSFPQTVTIAKGQSGVYFYADLSANGLLDADTLVVCQIEGNGYEPVETRINITDDTYPNLYLQTEQASVLEGETLSFTIGIQRPLSHDLDVHLTCQRSSRFNIPETIRIEAMHSSTDVVVTAIQNDVPNIDEVITFTVTAPAHNAAKTDVTLMDDDLPTLQLTITPTEVSENAGPLAMNATLRRLDNIDKAVTINFSDDSQGGIHYDRKQVSMPAGVESVIVKLGPTDNQMVDGDRVVNIDATVFIPSCSCNASTGKSAGAVRVPVTIYDNDGPTLSLTSTHTTMLEGDANGAQVTLSRNADITNALDVEITTSAAGLQLPQLVTIPAGQTKVTFTVIAPANDQQEGNRVVTLTAKAEGYSNGTIWMMISDQTLPDIEITSMTPAPQPVVAGQPYTVNITLANHGAAPVPERSVVSYNGAGSSIMLTVPESIAVGDSSVQSVTFDAPSLPGDYRLTATANPGNTFTELQTFNNTATSQLQVISPYSYTITTDSHSYGVGQVVTLSGSIKANANASVSGIEVEPYLLRHNYRTKLSAVTAEDGTFQLEYLLSESAPGEYGVGVCLPGEGDREVMTSFGVYGLSSSGSNSFKCYLYVSEEYILNLSLKNLSNLPLHNIVGTQNDNNSQYQVEIEQLTELAGNAEARVRVKMKSDVLSTPGQWDRIHLTFTSDEGASTSFLIYSYNVARQAQLTLSSQSINSTVTKGQPRIIPVQIVNTGLSETGEITIDIPTTQNFVSLATPNVMPSLQTGDTLTFQLRFDPGNLDVNIVQKGQIAINCANANGCVLAYNIKVVSEDKGSLRVRVQDENTIYGNAAGEHPYVNGATVRLCDYNSGATLAQLTTGEEGDVLFDAVNEGYYRLIVTADKHDSYTQNVLVNPGEETYHLASISYQAISVTYTVEETTVEDEYQIQTELVYETQVPVPVVVMNSPSELDLNQVLEGHDLLYNVMLTNVGLITAQTVTLSLPSAEGFRFTALTASSGFDLAPEQSCTIPVLVTLDSDEPASASRRAAGGAKCSDRTFLDWSWVCNEEKHKWIEKPVKYLLRTCDPDDPEPNNGRDKTNDDQSVPDPPRPNDHEPGEPQIWEPSHPYSQVDLYGAYQLSSAISCAMSCFLPPPDKWDDIKKEALDIDTDCIKKELSSTHAPSRRTKDNDSMHALLQRYYDAIMLIIGIGNNKWNYYSELTGAPALADDEKTFNMLAPYIDDVNALVDNWHSNGTLYGLSDESKLAATLPMMPQQRSDWYDFSLPTYLNRITNNWKLRDGMTVTDSNHSCIDSLDVQIQRMHDYDAQIVALGYADWDDLVASATEDANAYNEGVMSTCAKVKLEISQELYLSRQAFRATLVIDNATDSIISDISVSLYAKRPDGGLATSHEMEITNESVEGFQATGDSWLLPAKQTGKFTYLFIPTRYAAPITEVIYGFGGNLTFNDGNGVQQRPLYPVELAVKPSPVLDLSYFMQRDIYGDDPLTLDVVEPVIPAEFSVLIHNTGYGDANDVRMITHQPKIIENEKGLAVDFAIVSSSLNGAPATLALEDDISTEFGTIPAGNSAYATWWLTSSLLGHFSDYDVSYTHLTSYGNPDLSLLNDVSIYRLIHSFNADIEGTSYKAWAIDDMADVNNYPDQLYLSNGTKQPLHALPEATTIEPLGNAQFRISVEVPTREWFYSKVANPYGVHARIASIVDEDRGAELDPENFWTTDYTMRDGKEPLQECNLHIVDWSLQAGTRHYILSFEEMPDTILQVLSIEGLPSTSEDGLTVSESVKHLEVTFNKAIKANTFSYSDMSLHWDGKILDTSKIKISAIDNCRFDIDLSELTANNGLYSLKVQTAGIQDEEGYYGQEGLGLIWIQFDPEDIASVYAREDISQISLFRADGLCLVKAATFEGLKLNTLPQGVYVLSIQTKRGDVITQRVMKP